MRSVYWCGTCDVFVGAVARVCVRYSGVSHVCMHTMLDSTTKYQQWPLVISHEYGADLN